MKSWGRPRAASQRGRGVGLPPAVVVLAGGEQEVVPPWVVRQAAGPPEGEDLPREVGVVGLGDEQQGGGFRDDDHLRELTACQPR